MHCPFPPSTSMSCSPYTLFSMQNFFSCYTRKGSKRKTKSAHAAVAINRRSISSLHPALGSQGVVLVLDVDVVVDVDVDVDVVDVDVDVVVVIVIVIVVVVVVPLSRGLLLKNRLICR